MKKKIVLITTNYAWNREPFEKIESRYVRGCFFRQLSPRNERPSIILVWGTPSNVNSWLEFNFPGDDRIYTMQILPSLDLSLE